VHEVGEADGLAFIAMETIEGESLEQVIRRGRLLPDRVWAAGGRSPRARTRTGGGAWTQLTDNPGPDLRGAWSPAGREVAHLTIRPGYLGLWVTPATGGPGRPVTKVGESVAASDWSPDGRYILTTVDGRIALADVSAEGRTETVTKNRGFFGRFSSDASRICYVGAAGGHLWTVRRDSTESALATDDRNLYFTWDEDLGDIWTMEVKINR
jgi:hypothetical protein